MDIASLKSLVWFLILGALFYWMMSKGGCGAMAHGGRHAGHGAGGGRPPDTAARVKDPVCGMSVEPARAAGTRESMGRTLHFCSAECLAKFDEDPDRYARQIMDDEEGQRRSRRGC